MEFTKSSFIGSYATIFFLSILLIIPFLDYSLVYRTGEAREGTVVQEILRRGEFVLPLRNGELVPSKPLLFHWLSVALAKVRGTYDDFGLRLPSAIAALGILSVLFFFLSRTTKRCSAIVGTLVLLSTYGFYRLAGDARVDMVFSFFVVSAILVWLDSYILERETGEKKAGAVRNISSKIYWLVGFLAGLSVLAKGPLGVVLIGLVLFTMIAVEEGFRATRFLFRPGWILVPVISLPWYFAALERGDSQFVSRQLIFENIGRFLGSEGISAKPFWFYAEHIWGQAAPWSFVFFGLLVFASWKYFYAKIPEERDSFFSCFGKFDTQTLLTLRSGIVWMLTFLLFFSLSVGKRRSYLLPLLPALSLVLGILLPVWLEKLQKESLTFLNRIGLVLSLFVAGVGGVFLVFSLTGHLPEFQNRTSEVVVNSLEHVIMQSPFLLLSYLLPLSAFGIYFWKRGSLGRAPRDTVLGFFCLTMLVFVFLNVSYAAKAETKSYKKFAETVASSIAVHRKLYFVKEARDEAFDTFFYYYPEVVQSFPPEKLPTVRGFYIARRSWLEKQPIHWKSQVEIQVSGGRLRDTRQEELLLFELIGDIKFIS